MNSTAPHAPAMTPCAMLADLEARLDILAQLLTGQDQAPGETTDTDHDHDTEDFPHE